MRSVARVGLPAVRRRLLQRRCPHQHVGVQRHGFFGGGAKLVDDRRPARQDHCAGARGRDRRGGCRPRPEEPAGRGEPRPGHRPGRRLRPRRGRRDRPGGARAWAQGPHGRRPLRQCAGAAGMHAGTGHLEGRRGHPLVRRHQERRPARRRDRRVRTRRPRTQIGFHLRRAGHIWSKMRFASAQILAYVEDGLWLRLAGRSNDAAARIAARIRPLAGVRLEARPSRPTSCSSRWPRRRSPRCSTTTSCSSAARRGWDASSAAGTPATPRSMRWSRRSLATRPRRPDVPRTERRIT